MKPLQIYRKVKFLESHDIYELYRNRGIGIVHNPDLFVDNTKVARIISDIFGNTTVFLRMRSGEYPMFENFILWHELGHIETYGLALDPESYDAKTKNKQREIECNMFAFFGMFYTNRRLIRSADSKFLGMPEDVLENVITTLSQDEEFMKYLDVK